MICMHGQEVEVLITDEKLYSQDEKLWQKLNYDMDICLGELIRNCCVNLGFSDIDTVDGITRNAAVYLCDRRVIPHKILIWEYNPYTSLRSFLATGPRNCKNSISLVFKQLY